MQPTHRVWMHGWPSLWALDSHQTDKITSILSAHKMRRSTRTQKFSLLKRMEEVKAGMGNSTIKKQRHSVTPKNKKWEYLRSQALVRHVTLSQIFWDNSRQQKSWKLKFSFRLVVFHLILSRLHLKSNSKTNYDWARLKVCKKLRRYQVVGVVHNSLDNSTSSRTMVCKNLSNSM